MRAVRTAIPVVWLVVLSACTQTDVIAPSVVGNTSADTSRGAMSLSSMPTLDETWRDWAVGPTKGFAGFYKRADGRYVVLTTSRDAGASYAANVATLVAAGDANLRQEILANVEVQQAKYDFADLYRWRSAIVREQPPTASFDTDINEVDNQIVVHFSRADMAGARARIGALKIPVAALRVGETKAVWKDGVSLLVVCDSDCPPGGGGGASYTPYKWEPYVLGSDPTPAVEDVYPNIGLAAFFPSLTGGVIFGHTNSLQTGSSKVFACTVGLPVRRNGQPGFLTAEHCAINAFSTSFGSNFLQNSAQQMLANRTASLIGTSRISSANPTSGAGCVASCYTSDVQWIPVGTRQNQSLCIAKPFVMNVDNPMALAFRANVLAVSNGGCGFSVVLRIIGLAPLEFVGLGVDKVGIASGWTRGTINQTCLVGFRDGYAIKCVNAVVSSVGGLHFSEDGDSGSPIFANSGSSYFHGILSGGDSVVGIHSYKRSYYSPLMFSTANGFAK